MGTGFFFYIPIYCSRSVADHFWGQGIFCNPFPVEVNLQRQDYLRSCSQLHIQLHDVKQSFQTATDYTQQTSCEHHAVLSQFKSPGNKMNVQTVIHDNQDTSVSSKYVKVEEISGEMNHIPSLT